MTPAELRLAADFLRELADRMSNDRCNDWEYPEDWSGDERREFVRQYHEFNGDPEEFDPTRTRLANFCAVALLAHKLRALVFAEPSLHSPPRAAGGSSR